jgi:prepilin-type N-terminal cleavage/methylation domain-containing protein
MLKASAGCAAGRVGGVRARRRAGFTLVELLVVIMIIGLVVAIILPALAGARTAAKGGATRTFIQEILKASEAWRLDKQGRAPGYFSARLMGHQDNETRGFSAMQNMMADLMGGLVADNAGNDPDVLQVGPLSDPTTQIYINRGLMGSEKGYFAPDKRFMQVQDGSEGGTQFGDANHQRLPSIVDSWGNPILLWMEDETAIGAITTKDQFALVNSGNGTDIARFYWASNAGFLKSTAMGKSAKDQNYGGDPDGEYSFIGGGVPDADVQDSLVGILGNPSYPSDLVSPLINVVPTQARGRVVLESAGPDGVFFGSRDKGANRIDDAGPEFKSGVIMYLNNFYFNNGSLTRYTDDKGNPTIEVVTDKFDEILVGGGN